ncbi:UNVERIFIED_CONTAM: hypothetical protein K2H54_026925 [Gekko kuhli]
MPSSEEEPVLYVDNAKIPKIQHPLFSPQLHNLGLDVLHLTHTCPIERTRSHTSVSEAEQICQAHGAGSYPHNAIGTNNQITSQSLFSCHRLGAGKHPYPLTHITSQSSCTLTDVETNASNVQGLVNTRGKDVRAQKQAGAGWQRKM